MADINVTEDIININVTEEVITIEAPTGGYPTPSTVYSVFGRTGAVVAAEGDYTLTQLGDVTIATPSNGQVLRYNGTTWVNATESFAGTVTSVNMSVPTGLTISGNPITTSGTLAVGLGAGYVIPTQANLDAKQDDLNGTGIVKSTAGTITYLSDNTANWNTAYNDSIVSASVTGTATKTLTLNQQDGGSVTASWTDTDTGLTSVGLSMPSAFSVANSPLTANGTLSVTGAGIASQYIRGDGTLANFPTSGGGGSSVAYYFNSSVSQGTLGGVAYRELSKVPIIGTGTDITISSNGYIGNYITDPNDPSLLSIPAGNWNFEMYFSANNGGGTPSFYVELYKYDGTTFTLIASSSSTPEGITNGTAIDLYITALAVPATSLTLTDRLAIRVYVNNSGRTITLHTEDNHLCEVITTFSTGLTALNGLTAQVQYFATGTSGTDFNISSSTATHTFNLPTASATNRGLLSSADWTTFNSKQNALTNPVTGTGTTNTLPKFTGASTIGNSNVSDSGTLITLGSNVNLNGNVAIGVTPLTGYNLYIFKSLTGATTTYGIAQTSSVLSDVTNSANANLTQLNTQAASFTLVNYNHYVAGQGSIGAGSVVTNQNAFLVGSSLIGATNNYGFRGQIPSGTNRWNLYMDGTANNYMAGGLGIGSTNIGGGNGNINIARNITGNAFSTAIWQNGTVQSDVTGGATSYQSDLKTVAASFTLTEYIHYLSNQITIGAGSAVTNQSGFYANSNLIGATNNYGFRGRIPVGANRWNLYMDGMAANYLAGDTGIGTVSLGTATQLTIGGTETAVSAISRGQLINTTLVASANSDVLVGLDIAPTFTNGAFTGVRNYGLRVNGTIYTSGAALDLGRNASGSPQTIIYADSSETTIMNTTAGARIAFRIGGNDVGRFFPTTGNFILQNGGTFTDAGFRLDVNGTTRFIGTASSDTAPLGAELAAVTGTGTNWTLAGTNLNVGGYTHTVGSVVPLTTALAAVNGTYYQIAYTITGRTAGTITIAYGGTSTTVSSTGASGPLASSTAVLTITPTTDFDGTVVLSIKTIGTSVASSTFSNSGSTSNIEVRTSNLTTNTFIGLSSGRRNTTGTFNTFIGASAGSNNTTASNNTFVGQVAGFSNTTGAGNTIVGSFAGQNNTTGNFNTFIGNSSGIANTTGQQNTFLGINSGNSNTTATGNTFLGAFAGQANTTGGINTFIGQNSGQVNTTGSQNLFIGNNSGLNNNATFNLFVGQNAGQNNTSGGANSYIGQNSGASNVSGNNNLYIGGEAGTSVSSGSSSVLVGRNAGRYIADKSTATTIINDSILIGSTASPLANNQTNQIVIGHNSTGLGSNTTVIGNSSTLTTALYGDLLLGTTTPSTATMLTVSGTETASSAIARGGLINTTLVASANNDVLVGLDINNTFTNGAFTGVTNAAIRANGSIIISGNNAVKNITSTSSLSFGMKDQNETPIGSFVNCYGFNFSSANQRGGTEFVFDKRNSGTGGFTIFGYDGGYAAYFKTFVSGNVLIQNGGSFTDAGFRLDVNGTARVQGNLTTTQYNVSALNTAPASATATGTLGEIRITAGFIYVCTATNTWVRTALTTW